MPAPEAFTLEQAALASEVPASVLRHWDNEGVLVPGLFRAKARTPYGRIYAFCDLVFARALAALQRQFELSHDELRVIAERMRRSGNASWAEPKFLIDGDSLWLEDAEGRLSIASVSDATVTPPFADLTEIARETEMRAILLSRRQESDFGQIVSRRYVMGNRPVLSGTRIPTEAVWDFYSAGYDIEQILEEYPRLTRLDVERAIEFEEQRRHFKQAS